MKLKVPHLNDDQKFFVLTLITGLAAGFIAIALHKSIHFLQHFLGTANGFAGHSFIFGGILVLLGGIITTRYMPAAAGSGIPRIKILIAVHHGFISTKEWVLKFIATILTLSSGAPLGYEAPTIFIAGGVGSTLGRWTGFSHRRLKDLIYVGCAAGIAAAFNTPIAAVVFVAEEIVGNMNTKSIGPILISSFIASVTASALIGQNSIFTPMQYSFTNSKELLFYLAVGVVAGVAGPLFIKSTLSVKKITNTFFKYHRLLPIIFSFIVVGLLSLITPAAPGNGLIEINDFLVGHVPAFQALAVMIAVKFLGSALCNGAGMSGGIMLPVMFLGAALGGLFGHISTFLLGISDIQIGAYCLVGMGAFFASVIKAPFTSIILIFEMTRDYKIVLPLMLANLVAYFISERLSPGSIYESSAHFEGYELPGHEEEDLMNQSFVEYAFVAGEKTHHEKFSFAEVIYPDQTLSYALTKLRKMKHLSHLKVVNRVNPHEELGTISLQNILDYLSNQHHS